MSDIVIVLIGIVGMILAFIAGVMIKKEYGRITIDRLKLKVERQAEHITKASAALTPRKQEIHRWKRLHNELGKKYTALETDVEIMWDMLVDAYMDELKVDEAKAHAMVTFDFEGRQAAQEERNHTIESEEANGTETDHMPIREDNVSDD